MPALTIDKNALEHNISLIRQLAGDADIIAVLKHNAYGLGLCSFAAFLQKRGIRHFAVTDLADATALRKSGIAGNILLLTPLYDFNDIITAILHDIELSITSPSCAEALESAATYLNRFAVPAQLCIDTGFGRYGFLPQDSSRIIDAVYTMHHIRITGIFSHLHASACRDESCVRKQFADFTALCETLSEAGIALEQRHISSSSSLLKFPDMRLDAVRIGSAFVGRLSVPDTLGFQEVCRLTAHITDVHTLPAGHNVGYGNSFRLRRPAITAVTDAGYCHGLGVKHTHYPGNHGCAPLYILRRLKQTITSKAPCARYQDKLFPVLGQICMNCSIIDITDCPLSVGDVVTFPINPVFVDSEVARQYV